MSARGTIAYICSRGGSWYLAASQQIPYDMGPDMHNGKELLKCFKEFFYSERKHCSGERKMHSLLNAFVKKTNIEIDGTFFKYHELPQNSDRTKIIIDLQSKKDSRGNFNLENDFFAKALHYSDWVYLMPLCPMINFQFKCEADDPNWHGEGPWPKYTINSLHEGSVQIFHFRDFKYSYDGNEFEIETENADKKDEPFEEAESEEPNEYVEILSQYRDGNRDCLVVRTSDNKHVLFKQMN